MWLHFWHKNQQGRNMFVSDALYRLHIEAHQDVHDVSNPNFLYLNMVHICYNYEYLAHNLYENKAKQTKSTGGYNA